MGGCYGPEDDEPQPPWTRKDWVLWWVAAVAGAVLLYAWFQWGPEPGSGPMYPPNSVEGAAERIYFTPPR
jgi:hypothetical protein